MKPLIAITCSWAPEKENRPEFPDPALDYIKSQYSQKIVTAGGVPVILPNIAQECLDEKFFADYTEKLDGVLLSGGFDIEPVLYNEGEKHPDTKSFLTRDYFELALLRYIIEKTDIPVFGICRGHQVLNVVLGGTLWQDIALFHNDSNPPVLLEHRRIPDNNGIKKRVWHFITAVGGTRLASIIGKKPVLVNSSHHQFVNRIANGLIVSAAAPDNACEALEMPGEKFVLSVQWHPEAMNDESSRKLFAAFLSASKNYSKKRRFPG